MLILANCDSIVKSGETTALRLNFGFYHWDFRFSDFFTSAIWNFYWAATLDYQNHEKKSMRICVARYFLCVLDFSVLNSFLVVSPKKTAAFSAPGDNCLNSWGSVVFSPSLRDFSSEEGVFGHRFDVCGATNAGQEVNLNKRTVRRVQEPAWFVMVGDHFLTDDSVLLPYGKYIKVHVL